MKIRKPSDLDKKPSQKQTRYALEELLAKCDLNAPFPLKDREWVASPPVGRELL